MEQVQANHTCEKATVHCSDAADALDMTHDLIVVSDDIPMSVPPRLIITQRGGLD